VTHTPACIQPPRLPRNISFWPDAPAITRQLERLEALAPEVACVASSRQAQEYALAYAERYQGNLPQLEHEWDFLTGALERAWQYEEYEVVVRLVAVLAYPAGRRGTFAEAGRVLRLGIAACRRSQDRRHFAIFLNRFGSLLFSYGKYWPGRRLWSTGLYLAEPPGSPQGLWEPLSNFAQIVDMLGNHAAAQRFLDTFYAAHPYHDLAGLAVAHFARGLYARFTRKWEEACADFTACLRLLVPQAPGTPLSFSHQLFLLVVQAELARAQGEYTRSREYTETALSLAQLVSDRYTLVTLLIDQAMFACWQGQLADARQAFLRLREAEAQGGLPHIAPVNRFLEQQLALNTGHALESQPVFSLSPGSSRPPVLLSEREKEVLRLVAEGLSSREIAERLVITSATVKKHLEHIYTRLDVHNRTSALAQARKLNIIS
jgi:DNA-binding CsgD family transcriptional regulator